MAFVPSAADGVFQKNSSSVKSSASEIFPICLPSRSTNLTQSGFPSLKVPLSNLICLRPIPSIFNLVRPVVGPL